MSVAESQISETITEQQNSELDLSAILKTIREGILIVGENMRVLAANDAALSIFGRDAEDLIGRRLSEIIRNISIHDAFLRAIRENEFTQVKVDVILDENRSFDVSVTPLDQGGSKRAVGVFYDVTQVERLEKVRQEFLSNISHELRTPLTSILAFIETLENGGIDDDLNKGRFLGIIRKNAERMHLLIDDISELSSIEAGKIKIDPKRIRLAALVKEVFASLSAKAGERNILLENDVADDAEVTADVIRLEQMLTNIIDNAIKFNRESGLVTVRFRKGEPFDVIEISDTGEGILKEQIPRIFERLYRADRARSREVGGTGLGLAIVKHLARLHGGTVEVSSVLGEGSAFSIQLPSEVS